ncbi:MAG: hypothetical protein WA743_11875, partial [Pseudolabrys sp.]
LAHWLWAYSPDKQLADAILLINPRYRLPHISDGIIASIRRHPHKSELDPKEIYVYRPNDLKEICLEINFVREVTNKFSKMVLYDDNVAIQHQLLNELMSEPPILELVTAARKKNQKGDP